jgi:2-amino-4-hydroxy-6-hydroxymethyldihydropteridine diphosphokinase
MDTQGVEVWIGLGSNLADPERQLELALAALQQLALDDSLRCSSFYLSKALLADSANEANGQQPDYVNAVATLRTTLLPHDLLGQLQSLETLQGRVRDEAMLRWSPRTLDLDILLYGDHQIDTPTLTVPHPGIRLREFVLYPMQELSPALEIPLLGSLERLVERCPRRGMSLLKGYDAESLIENAS